MKGKKSETKFTLILNKHDPSHIRVAELLNNQGYHGKSHFIVKAILHYEECNKIQDIKMSKQFDEKYIETLINRLLTNKKSSDINNTSKEDVPINNHNESSESINEINIDDAFDTLGQDGLNAIQNAMEMFRR
jgi:hypothetical protein